MCVLVCAKYILSSIQKAAWHFSVVLNGEFAGTKISAEGLFTLPICVIMETMNMGE